MYFAPVEGVSNLPGEVEDQETAYEEGKLGDVKWNSYVIFKVFKSINIYYQGFLTYHKIF